MYYLGKDLICFSAIHSLKVRSLIDLSCAGFPIVPTLCFNTQEIPNLKELYNNLLWSEQTPLYVRVCFDSFEYPHSFYKICQWTELQQTLCTLIAKISVYTYKPCDITIQPQLAVTIGGALANLDNLLVIEAVDGNARGLLRAGQFSNRIIYHNNRVISETFGKQQKAFFENENGYQHRSGHQITWHDIQGLSEFSYNKHTLYEFCIIQVGKPLFLEMKKLPPNTFFFDNNGVFTIYSSKEIINRQFFSIPLLSLRDQLNHKKINTFLGGAYLAHLSFFAASKQFPMCFL